MFAEQCGMKTPKTLQTGDDHRELHLKSLPQQFVLKPSNFWNSAKVIRDKGICEVVSIDTIMGIPTGIGYFVKNISKDKKQTYLILCQKETGHLHFQNIVMNLMQRAIVGVMHGMLIQL